MKSNSKKPIRGKVECRWTKYNRRGNCGSATIEMTIILAVVLVIFYLYITLFLFFIHSAKDMAIMTETLYWQEGQRDNSKEKLVVHVAGDKKTIQSQIVMKNLSKNLEVHRYNDSPIENIRRWQLATDTILQRGTP